ncbi:MAG: YcxB family protein [Gammaproteobacteria bacterium]|nr:MAG: YcxB family protein [Gammaproteobacteria bacterium]
MEITFQNSADLESKAFTEIQRIIYTEQSVNSLVQYLVVLYWMSIMSGVMFFTVALLSPQMASNGLYLIVSMMLFIALAANHYFLKITDFSHQANTLNTFRQHGTVTITLTEEGLRETAEKYDMFFDWRMLNKIYATKTNFYIMFSGISLYVPMKSFNCDELLNRFALEMEDLSHAEVIRLQEDSFINNEEDKQ